MLLFHLRLQRRQLGIDQTLRLLHLFQLSAGVVTLDGQFIDSHGLGLFSRQLRM
jgi:hypothetical protein